MVDQQEVGPWVEVLALHLKMDEDWEVGVHWDVQGWVEGEL